jgi:hypothetical protein
MSANSSVGRGLTFGSAGGWLSGVVQLVQRANGGGDHLRRHRGVTGGGVDSTVAEQHLNDADIGAVLQQVSGEAVPQGVDRDPLGDVGAQGGFAAGQL